MVDKSVVIIVDIISHWSYLIKNQNNPNLVEKTDFTITGYLDNRKIVTQLCDFLLK